MLNKEMSKIDWNLKTSDEIKNLVRGLNPIMGTYTFLNGKKVKFWRVKKITESEFKKEYEEYKIDNCENGTVILANEKLGLFIKANDGIISVIEIQGENARKMNIGDFLRGNKVQIGDLFK